TTYVNCSYWINPSLAALLSKGSLVELNGRISVKAFMTGNNEARASLNCHVNDVRIHQFGKRSEQISATTPSTVAPPDDLPF
ncbi:MAG: single-stranded DNA-binding protein, partial [Bacteroidota bacterium]